MSAELPCLLVCGPQTVLPSSDYLAQLRSHLINDHDLQDLTLAIVELPDLWSVLLEAQPSLGQDSGLKLLQDFKEWITNDDFTFQIPETLPNIQLAVLTVIIQIVEYIRYLNTFESGDAQGLILNAVRNGGVQGLCTGFLTAIALACSKDKSEICKHGAIAMRLAACTGAWIDLDRNREQASEKMISFTARWTPTIGEQTVMTILQRYPEAYISVRMDTTTATITAPEPDASSLLDEFTERGVIVKKIDLHGRFHHPAHEKAFEELGSLCASEPLLQFHPDSRPLAPIRRNDNGEVLADELLHDVAFQCLLKEKVDWHSTMTASVGSIMQAESNEKPLVLLLGLIDCIPRSLMMTSSLRVVHALPKKTRSNDSSYTYPGHSIAIVGAACRFPGADSLHQFWEIVRSGTSMQGKLPEGRFHTSKLRRSLHEADTFPGNFIRDADAFDHRFFGKSSREALYMDPQHRIALETAYEALESAGYFSQVSATKDIGCYVGVAGSDYEDNIDSHLPTAFSFTGTARAFVSGKISHFFGWNGPSVVIDTACSSSAVAIHTACKAIQSGECVMALAGGVNVITSPNSHHNLSAATFLSPTGACRSFDAGADGYCRGEGGGFVLMKKLSSAIADNDDIFGVLVGSAVNQSDGSCPITVPVSQSQISLYHRALSMASMQPHVVSFVEAHGTGTPKGDPIECQSIRQVFGGQTHQKLHLGSVKGNIGHTEAASGVAGLIKVLLMMRHNEIPPQANFTRLNPAIPSLEPDNMAVATTSREWKGDFHAACINNYGAAGSNAAMVVCQPPRAQEIASVAETRVHTVAPSRYPFLIAAHSAASLRQYCTVLNQFVAAQYPVLEELLLPSVAFHHSQKQNQTLRHRRVFTAKSTTELKDHLSQIASEVGVVQPLTAKGAKPVVLVFAGQTGDTIRFSEEAYRGSLLLKLHLDRCDRILRSLGLNSLFPRIYSLEPIGALVDLHCILFSLQYACAMSWIDAGLNVKTLVGHSFGQLTALCVGGAITLPDALKLISGRAALIQARWGSERGCMLSVDADVQTLQALARSIPGEKVEIACYNAPSNHVLVGTEAAIKEVETVATSGSCSPPVKIRRLNVTHGFHSEFVDCMMEEYHKLTKRLIYRTPTIPIETCSKHDSWAEITPHLVAQQSRDPVYFSDAIARIEQRLGPCNWVEAGSGSVAVSMTRRALNTSTDSSHSFHSAKLGGPDPLGSLADMTHKLWNEGVEVQFWPYHRLQRSCFKALDLPPYQFEKSRHWLPYVDKQEPAQLEQPRQPVTKTPTLVSLDRYLDTDQREAEFSIDQRSEEYDAYVRGRVVLGKILCPASLYMEIAARAANLLTAPFRPSARVPQIEKLEMQASLGFDLTRNLQLTLRQGAPSSWEFVVSSHACDENPLTSKRHVTGRICLQDPDSPKLGAHRSRFQRLIDYQRCQNLLDDPEASVIQGLFVYKMFQNVIDYTEIYRGIKLIASKGHEAVGHVVMPSIAPKYSEGVLCNPLVLDNFTQVVEMHANSLQDCGKNEIYLCAALDEILFYTNMGGTKSESGPWMVYSTHDRVTDREIVSDIFVFNAVRKTLVLTIFGARFSKVLISSLQKALNRVNDSGSGTATDRGYSGPFDAPEPPRRQLAEHSQGVKAALPVADELESTSMKVIKPFAIQSMTRRLLHEVTGAAVEDICERTRLRDLGIDSLIAIELRTGIRELFQIDLPISSYEQDWDVKTLCQELSSQAESRITVGSASSSQYLNDDHGSPDLHTPCTEVSNPSNGDKDAHSGDLIFELLRLVSEHLNSPDRISPDTILHTLGLDSLVSIELESDIEKIFGKRIRLMQLDSNCTLGDLINIIIPRHNTLSLTVSNSDKLVSELKELETEVNGAAKSHHNFHRFLNSSEPELREVTDFVHQAAEEFACTQQRYSFFAQETGFAGFYARVYPKQASLVLAYVVEAFAVLGCELECLRAGDQLPPISHIPKHRMVVSQFYQILDDAGLISHTNSSIVRTAKTIDCTKSSQLYKEILAEFPQHRSEHQLLNSTGSRLADCLSGKVDALQLLFKDQAARDLLEDVYTSSPMFATGTKILGRFLTQVLPRDPNAKAVRILELGAGTGATTKHIVDHLLAHAVKFTYTYTDISVSLVASAKKKFSRYDCMEYMVLDIEQPPPPQVMHSYDIVISSNCIHAAENMLQSSTNIYNLLRHDGMLCLLELTRRLFWLDCVFGLLDGWWRFKDGRKYVLADESQWKKTLLDGGFRHVDWTDDETRESDQFRLIMALKLESQGSPVIPLKTMELN